MDDLISRQAAIDIVVFECGEWTGLAKEISKQLKQLPSAQPEIIRCKDCKHWHNAPTSDGYNSCEKDALIRHENFFCAAAERKE